MSKHKNVIIEELSDAIDKRFTQYAFMSLEDRALPDARDGLKPSQRRVLVAMNDLGLNPKGSTEKCAKICGDTSGNYHPHGEAVVYPTMYRMVQQWVLRYPLLTGQGNFGNVDGDPPAAMRYTEGKLSFFGESMLSDLSKDTVPFVNNYNEKRQEPTILPALLPNLLINGCEGIAVGWATKMLPHNLREIISAIKAYIANPQITCEELIKLVPGPDFPTAGKILGQDGILEYYKTGRGTVLMEGKHEIEKNKIIITELPYQSSPDELSKEIEALVESQKLTGLADLKNLSSKKTGIRLVLEMQKNANPNLIINVLLKSTCLRRTISVNSTVLIEGKVVPNATFPQLIAAFVDHRKVVLTNKYTAELERAKKRLHIVEGLISACKVIERVVKLVIEAADDTAAEASLIAENIVQTEIQAKAILELTLRRLTKLENKNLLSEKEKLKNSISWMTRILRDKQEILKLIVTEQEKIAFDLGDDRRTEISGAVVEIENEDLIKDEHLVVTLTLDGYVKSVPADNYKIQSKGGKGVLGTSDKTEAITEIFEAKSKHTVLFFTNHGRAYQRRAYEIPAGSKTGKGTHVSNILELGENEVVTNMIALKTMDKGHLVFVTKRGLVKRAEVKDYNSSRKNAGIVAINLTDGDELAFVFTSTGKRDIFLVTAQGYFVRYSEKLVPVQGRSSRGARGIKLGEDDKVVQAFAFEPSESPDILVATSGGFGKKTASKEFRSSANRAVRGNSVIKKKALEKNGLLVSACSMVSGDSFLVLTSGGKIIRLDQNDIRESGRTSTGVRIVKLDGTEKVLKIAKVTQLEDT